MGYNTDWMFDNFDVVVRTRENWKNEWAIVKAKLNEFEKDSELSCSKESHIDFIDRQMELLEYLEFKIENECEDWMFWTERNKQYKGWVRYYSIPFIELLYNLKEQYGEEIKRVTKIRGSFSKIRMNLDEEELKIINGDL